MELEIGQAHLSEPEVKLGIMNFNKSYHVGSYIHGQSADHQEKKVSLKDLLEKFLSHEMDSNTDDEAKKTIGVRNTTRNLDFT